MIAHTHTHTHTHIYIYIALSLSLFIQMHNVTGTTREFIYLIKVFFWDPSLFRFASLRAGEMDQKQKAE
jgi:hypothetical protein